MNSILLYGIIGNTLDIFNVSKKKNYILILIPLLSSTRNFTSDE